MYLRKGKNVSWVLNFCLTKLPLVVILNNGNKITGVFTQFIMNINRSIINQIIIFQYLSNGICHQKTILTTTTVRVQTSILLAVPINGAY